MGTDGFGGGPSFPPLGGWGFPRPPRNQAPLRLALSSRSAARDLLPLPCPVSPLVLGFASVYGVIPTEARPPLPRRRGTSLRCAFRQGTASAVPKKTPLAPYLLRGRFAQAFVRPEHDLPAF